MGVEEWEGNGREGSGWDGKGVGRRRRGEKGVEGEMEEKGGTIKSVEG